MKLWNLWGATVTFNLRSAPKKSPPPITVGAVRAQPIVIDFRMTHWIINMSTWSIPLRKGHSRSGPFRPERGTVMHSKRNRLCSLTLQLPPTLLKSSFCYAIFFKLNMQAKWAVFLYCYRRVSGLRLPLIKPPWTLILLYQSLALKWVSQTSYFLGLKRLQLHMGALRSKSVCAGTHSIKFLDWIFKLPSPISCGYHTIKYKHPLFAVSEESEGPSSAKVPLHPYI